MKVPFEPYLDRVLLKRPESELEKRTAAIGIIIPESTDTEGRRPAKGVVVAVGETCRERMKGAIGETVLFAKFAGDTLNIDGEDYYIVADDDVLGFEMEVKKTKRKVANG